MKATEIDESITNEVLPIIGAGLAAGARLAAPAIARGVSNLLGRGGAQAAQTGARGAAQTAQRIEPKFDFSLPANFRQPGTNPATYNVQPGVPKPPSIVPSNMQTVTGPAAPRAASTAQPAGRINMPSTQAPTGQAGPAAGGRPYTPVDPKSTVAPKPDIGTSIGRDAATTVPGGATTAQKAAGAATAAGIGAAGIGTIGTSNRGATPPEQGSTFEPPRPVTIIPPGGLPTANPPTKFDPPGPDTDTSDRPGTAQSAPASSAAASASAPASNTAQTRSVATPSRPQLPSNVQDIATLNKLDNPNLIKPGQVLQLPGGGSYTVKAGDNLTKIAAQQGTSVPSNPALGAVAGSPPDLKIGDLAKVDPNASPEVKAAALRRDAQAALDASKNSVRAGPNPNIDNDTRDRADDFVRYLDPAVNAARQATTSAEIEKRTNPDAAPEIKRTGATSDDPAGDYELPKESLERILQLSGYKKYAGR